MSLAGDSQGELGLHAWAFIQLAENFGTCGAGKSPSSALPTVACCCICPSILDRVVQRCADALEPRGSKWSNWGVPAAAIYTGLRKGELLALRKADVDLVRQVLTVARSHERSTTKGGHQDGIPIATELVPFLKVAIASSPSELVFPKADGSMMRRDVNLEHTLRRALGRAGVVEGYRNVCRRQGCGHMEPAPDQEQRRCPKDGRKLWVKPVVRPTRFHDFRHTTGSLLIMSGADLAAVQRILCRHR